MLTALARSTRVSIGATFLAVLALSTGCGDQSVERRGGDDPPNLSAGSGGGDAGPAAEGGAAGVSSGTPVLWCDAYQVVNCVCQQCHQNPTVNGAAMPLMTYEDTQAPFPFTTSSTLVWERMAVTVNSRAMPETTNPSVMPPVKPLTDAQRTTLLDWFAQGAHDTGGRNCSATCNWSDGSPDP